MSEGPTIIRRKRVFASDGHHGGAWKVAYADFVTAMMAFFMLMWILNATSQQQRQGLADFFNPNIPLSESSGGGNDFFNGSSAYAIETLVADGVSGFEQVLRRDQALSQDLARSLETQLQSGDARITVTPEGVVVDLLDSAAAPVFALGSSEATLRLAQIIKDIAPALAEAQRPIKIVGHTDNKQFPGNEYSNWELSADRANAARRMLIGQGIPDARITEVSGQADRKPIKPDPSAPENRRIAIILLNSGG